MSYIYLNVSYKDLNMSGKQFLNFLVNKGLNRNFVNELIEFNIVDTFLNYVSDKSINKIIFWINDKYIEKNLNEIAKKICENNELVYNGHDYYEDEKYFMYAKWVLKTKKMNEVYGMIKNYIDLTDEFTRHEYLDTCSLVERLTSREFYEYYHFNENTEDELVKVLNNTHI